MTNLTISDGEILNAVDTINRDKAAEYLAELLMDDSNSTYKMLEELVSIYASCTSDESKNAVQSTVAVLTGQSLSSIVAALKAKAD